MSLTFAKSKSMAKKLYYTEVKSSGRNNYTMTTNGPDHIQRIMKDLKKKEVIEMIECWEDLTNEKEIY